MFTSLIKGNAPDVASNIIHLTMAVVEAQAIQLQMLLMDTNDKREGGQMPLQTENLMLASEKKRSINTRLLHYSSS